MSRDDQRLRELANRLVAMTPEPPPFPEEEVMLTTPVKSSRSRPVLAFVGAALLVLVGAAIPLLLNSTNGQQPIATTGPPPLDTSDAPATTTASPPTEPVTPTTVPTDTTGPAANVTYETAVFLVQSPEDSLMGNPGLVPFWTEVEGPEGASVELLRLQLLTEGRLAMPSPHFYSAVPADVEFLGIAREEQAILLEVNEAFRVGAGGLLADMAMLNQIVYTATYMSDADLVRFFIDGRAITDFGTDGLDLTGGVTRETFRDSLNAVFVTHPIYIGDGLPQVEGVANVFEATVSLEIVDADGEVSYADFTTATCGTGCWGEYSFSLDTPALTSDSLVRVFWNSPEDGSRRDVVYVPFAEEAVWDLLPEN